MPRPCEQIKDLSRSNLARTWAKAGRVPAEIGLCPHASPGAVQQAMPAMLGRAFAYAEVRHGRTQGRLAGISRSRGSHAARPATPRRHLANRCRPRRRGGGGGVARTALRRCHPRTNPSFAEPLPPRHCRLRRRATMQEEAHMGAAESTVQHGAGAGMRDAIAHRPAAAAALTVTVCAAQTWRTRLHANWTEGSSARRPSRAGSAPLRSGLPLERCDDLAEHVAALPEQHSRVLV